MQRPGVAARCTLAAFSVDALGLRGVLGVKPYVRLIGALWVLCALASCGEAPSPASASDSQVAQIAQVTGGPACAPTDQDQYVYDPRRLQVVQACIRVSGIVDALEMETDGDTVIHLHLDPPFQDLLRPANLTDERGNLVVELICMSQPVQRLLLLSTAQHPAHARAGAGRAPRGSPRSDASAGIERGDAPTAAPGVADSDWRVCA